jgi:hypothetical protein
MPSHTVLGGRFALRCAIANHRTRREDLDAFVRAVLETGAALLADHTPAASAAGKGAL